MAKTAKTSLSDERDVRGTILEVGQRIMSGKGFSAVGLNEILAQARVPKGSFYHYFDSKDAFGVAMLAAYFDHYHADMDTVLAEPGRTLAQRVLHYFELWRDDQSYADCQGKCLAVKLAAEVADLSEPMRQQMDRGTAGIIARLAAALDAGVAEASLTIAGTPQQAAESLYQQWLGASVMVKIVRHGGPFDAAMAATRRMLHLA
jgi:TetR/AcrR family transcriptional repressor of nem operon